MNIINRKWFPDNVLNIAYGCRNLSEFRSKYNHVYKAAIRLGLLDDIRKKLQKKPKKWDKNKLKKEALLYKTKKDFREKSCGAYIAAKRMKILDSICNHMLVTGSKYRRMIYAFEFSDKSVYVGLTYNYEVRYRSHMSKNKLIIDKTHKLGHIFVMFNEEYSIQQIGKEESKIINKYRKKGWTLLNVAKAGALGSTVKKWTPRLLLEIIAGFKTKKDFYKSNKNAYNAAYKSQDILVKKEFNNLKESYIKWTVSVIKKELDLYTTLEEFREYSPKAYRAIKRKKLDYLLEKNLDVIKKLKWDKEAIFRILPKYKTYLDFFYNERNIYCSALQQGLIDEIKNYFNYKGNKKWTKEMVIAEVNKYHYIKDFRINSPKAYSTARRLDLMNYVSSKLIKRTRRKWTKAKIIETAKKCSSYSNFSKEYPRAYEVARLEFKILDIIKRLYNH